MVHRGRPASTRFPTNFLYTPVNNTSIFYTKCVTPLGPALLHEIQQIKLTNLTFLEGELYSRASYRGDLSTIILAPQQNILQKSNFENYCEAQVK